MSRNVPSKQRFFWGNVAWHPKTAVRETRHGVDWQAFLKYLCGAHIKSIDRENYIMNLSLLARLVNSTFPLRVGKLSLRLLFSIGKLGWSTVIIVDRQLKFCLKMPDVAPHWVARLTYFSLKRDRDGAIPSSNSPLGASYPFPPFHPPPPQTTKFVRFEWKKPPGIPKLCP